MILYNKKNSVFLFVFFYWLAFNFLVLHTPFSIFKPPKTEAITDVNFLKSDAVSIQVLDRSVSKNHHWKTVSLPDDWYTNKADTQQIWYRTNISPLNLDEKIWAVYIPAVTHNAAVYINDIWIGQGGHFNDPVSRHHNKPLFFSFSSKLLHTGKNKIDIRVKTEFSEQGILDAFYVAPESDLRSYYEWKSFVRFDIVQWVTMAMYVLSVIIFIFWLARRKEIIYGLFAFELFIWATHNLNLTVSNIPVSAKLWEAMTISTIGWTVTAMIFFNHRFVGYGNKKVEKFTLYFSILGVGIFFLPDIESVLHIGYKIWDAFIVVFGVYAIFHLIKVYNRTEDSDVLYMILIGIPILVLGFHDVLMFNYLVSKLDGYTMIYSVIPSIILFSWFLVRRFVQSIDKAETLAETLEQRVADKQQELQSQYEELKNLQKENILSEERERLMRDMHDGIGGQLISVITLLQEQSGDIFKTIREKIQLSLVDLRFVIDSLDPLLNDLPTLLGMMRMRLVDQLEAANIELTWAVTELPEIKNISPRNSLHIMRIVQEAMTNSIKYSCSNKMTLATGIVNNKVFIDVIDYGKESKALNDYVKNINSSTGRGLKNMFYRANCLDAELDIINTNKGTTVRLVLNINDEIR